MKRFAKTLLSVLLLTVFLLTQTSCALLNPTKIEAAKLLTEANAVLSSQPHVISTSYDFRGEKSAFKTINNMRNTLTVDGDNFCLSSSVSPTQTRLGADLKVVRIDNRLYYYYESKYYPGMIVTRYYERKMADIPEQEQDNVLNELSGDGSLSLAHFSNITIEKTSGGTKIICSGLTNAGKRLMRDSIASITGTDSEKINLVKDSTTLTIMLRMGRISSTELYCEYIKGSSTYQAKISNAYGYTIYDKIAIPGDVSDYRLIDYKELLDSLT